jgi:hypothetical protein
MPEKKGIKIINKAGFCSSEKGILQNIRQLRKKRFQNEKT